MITIGLTGWSDHPLLGSNKKTTLEDYSRHFPFVEMDTSFYAIPPEKNIQSWMNKTPESFQFIPKAFQAMTKHKKWIDDFASEEMMFAAFLHRFKPMIEAKKVKAFLFQFPPYFGCTEANFQYLKNIRSWMRDNPVAIEFRNSSWFTSENTEYTLSFLREHNFIHTIVDQPQTPNNSIPMIADSTNHQLSILRLHGRNFKGWQGGNSMNWRSERTLYNYTKNELEDFATLAKSLESKSQEVALIFNNNSGGHAAKNAKELQAILQLSFSGLSPQQLDLF